MPFSMQKPQPFTQEDIERLVPGQIGVYGLMNKSHWVYVGVGDIRESLLAHFKNQTSCIAKHKPILFLYEVTSHFEQRERQLIREFEPIGNMG